MYPVEYTLRSLLFSLRAVIALWLFSFSLAAQAPWLPDDDHANTPATAALLTPSQAVSGQIAMRHDRDVFRFSALPYHNYTLRVTPASTGGIRDAEFRLLESDAATVLARANSAGTITHAETNTIHTTTARTLFVDVRSFAEYSTGGYQVLLTQSPPTDSDNDGLPDAWEALYGLSTSSAAGIHGAHGDFDNDGFSNLEEFLMGTNPAAVNSRLRITALTTLPGGAGRITWPAVPYATYRVRRASTLLSSEWTTLTTFVQPASSTTATFIDPAAPGAAVYHVEQVLP